MENKIAGLLTVKLEDINSDDLKLMISELHRELDIRENEKRKKMINNFLDALDELRENGYDPYIDLYGVDTEESCYLDKENIYFD